MGNVEDPDRNFAVLLQFELDSEFARYEGQNQKKSNISHTGASADDYMNSSKGIIDPNWELVDPTPNIINLFLAFNEKYFWNKLVTVCVVWSKRMMACAGTCSYEGRGGLCKIALSEPLLKLRPRKDLVETLLHEMIHAYLFVTDNNRDRDGHGPEFHKHMDRINASAGTKISVYHSFHHEVQLYRQHWWRCDGPCQNRHPFYGMVRRSQNRAPGPNDRWYAHHERNCGGIFIKIKEPEKQPTAKERVTARSKSNLGDIRKYIKTSGSPSQITASTSKVSSTNGVNVINGFHDFNIKGKSIQPNKSVNNNNSSSNKPGNANTNIVGFNDLKKPGFVNGGLRNSSSTIVITNGTIRQNSTSIKTDQTSPKSNTKLNESKNAQNITDLVRNHWINKYMNTSQTERSLKDDSTEEMPSATKKRKTTSTNKINCPICSKGFFETEINDHIDICLNSSQTTETCKYCEHNFATNHINAHLNTCPKRTSSDCGDCPICQKVILMRNLEEHVNRCLDDNTDDDIEEVTLKQCEICTKYIVLEEYNSHVQKCIVIELTDSLTDDFDYIKCSNCKQNMDSDEYKIHINMCHKTTAALGFKHCHICKTDIDAAAFADHLTNCFDKMMKLFNKNNLTSSSKETVLDSNKCVEIETVSCLVCNKVIDKSKLEQHLDDCLDNTIEGINEYDDEFNEDGESDSSNNKSANMNNCPICLKLIDNNEIILHLDTCLKDD